MRNLIPTLLLVSACTSNKGVVQLDSGQESGPDSCQRDANLYAYPGTLVEHADVNPLTDVKNTVMLAVYNLGTEPCPETELHLSHNDGDYFLNVPALDVDESTQLIQKGVILNEEGDVRFTATIDGVEVSVNTFLTRQVGSVSIGQMAEYLTGNGSLACLEDSDNGVPSESSYCEVMQLAYEAGLVTSDYSGGKEYDTLNHATLATVVVRAFPEYFDALSAPCDISPDEWYYGSLQAFQTAFPEIDFCDPNADTQIHELYGTTYPSGGVLDQLSR